MPGYADNYWTSPDGLRLHYRDYPVREGSGGENRPPILCELLKRDDIYSLFRLRLQCVQNQVPSRSM